jgi:hypothetical protein
MSEDLDAQSREIIVTAATADGRGAEAAAVTFSPELGATAKLQFGILTRLNIAVTQCAQIGISPTLNSMPKSYTADLGQNRHFGRNAAIMLAPLLYAKRRGEFRETR